MSNDDEIDPPPPQRQVGIPRSRKGTAAVGNCTGNSPPIPEEEEEEVHGHTPRTKTAVRGQNGTRSTTATTTIATIADEFSAFRFGSVLTLCTEILSRGSSSAVVPRSSSSRSHHRSVLLYAARSALLLEDFGSARQHYTSLLAHCRRGSGGSGATTTAAAPTLMSEERQYEEELRAISLYEQHCTAIKTGSYGTRGVETARRLREMFSSYTGTSGATVGTPRSARTTQQSAGGGGVSLASRDEGAQVMERCFKAAEIGATLLALPVPSLGSAGVRRQHDSDEDVAAHREELLLLFRECEMLVYSAPLLADGWYCYARLLLRLGNIDAASIASQQCVLLLSLGGVSGEGGSSNTTSHSSSRTVGCTHSKAQTLATQCQSLHRTLEEAYKLRLYYDPRFRPTGEEEKSNRGSKTTTSRTSTNPSAGGSTPFAIPVGLWPTSAVSSCIHLCTNVLQQQQQQQQQETKMSTHHGSNIGAGGGGGTAVPARVRSYLHTVLAELYYIKLSQQQEHKQQRQQPEHKKSTDGGEEDDECTSGKFALSEIEAALQEADRAIAADATETNPICFLVRSYLRLESGNPRGAKDDCHRCLKTVSYLLSNNAHTAAPTSSRYGKPSPAFQQQQQTHHHPPGFFSSKLPGNHGDSKLKWSVPLLSGEGRSGCGGGLAMMTTGTGSGSRTEAQDSHVEPSHPGGANNGGVGVQLPERAQRTSAAGCSSSSAEVHHHQQSQPHHHQQSQPQPQRWFFRSLFEGDAHHPSSSSSSSISANTTLHQFLFGFGSFPLQPHQMAQVQGWAEGLLRRISLLSGTDHRRRRNTATGPRHRRSTVGSAAAAGGADTDQESTGSSDEGDEEKETTGTAIAAAFSNKPRCHYEVLGLAVKATPVQIRKAYRSEALKWHPDKWARATGKEKRLAEQRFKHVSDAYHVLSDPQQRLDYDCTVVATR